MEEVRNSGLYGIEVAEAYFGLRERCELSNEALLDTFLRRTPVDSLDLPLVKKVVCRYSGTAQGNAFEYLKAHKDDRRCAVAIKRIADTHFKNAVAQKSEAMLSEALDMIAATEPDTYLIAHRPAILRMQFYLDTGQPQRFHEVASVYLNNQFIPALETEQDSERLKIHRQTLENLAWQYAEFVKKKSHLTQALAWLKRCPAQVISADCRRYRMIIEEKVK